MPNEIKVNVEEGFRLSISNGRHTIISDQPEGIGTDRGMQPVELFVASLASCVAVYAVSFLKKRNVDEKKVSVYAQYQYGDNPKRVRSIDVNVKLDGINLKESELKALHRVVEHCTVHNSITHSPDINISIS